MVFKKGNKFGGKKKGDRVFADEQDVITPEKENVIQDLVDKAVKDQKDVKYRCGGCKRSLDNQPLAHLIDLCIRCVEAKQPGGVFGPPHRYISGTSVKPNKPNDNK